MSRSKESQPPPKPIPWLWLLLGLVSGGGYLLIYFNPRLLWHLGVQHYDVWFADTFALLASNDAVTQGLNPYAPNPLDVFGRPHVYSHWWLQLRQLGLTRADIAWLGPLVVILFWLAALRWLRPRSGRQFLFYLALMVSSPVLLALDRANNDLIIFLLLTPLVPCLINDRAWVRFLAPLLIAAAAGLKYYPAAAGVVLLAPSPSRELRARLAWAIGLLALVGLSVAPDLALFGPLAPKPSGWMSFGAGNGFTQMGWTGPATTALSLACAAAWLAWGWRSKWLTSWSHAPEQRADWLRFVVGAALLAGCFFTSANFAYRWVFALWLAPFLWSLRRDPSAPAPARRLATVTGGLLLAALWLDTVFAWVAIYCRGRLPPASIGAWIRWSSLAEQPVTWALFACLLLFLARFAREGVTRLVAGNGT